LNGEQRPGLALDLRERLTVVMTTHVIPSAPATDVIEATLANTWRQLRVRDCRHVLCCDLSRSPSEKHCQYLENLRRLGERHAIELEVHCETASAQSPGFLAGIERVRTPYLLFLEHDWSFLEPVDLHRLTLVMDRYPFVNYIRFNKRENRVAAWDTRLEPEVRIAEFPLLRSWSYSSNPHISRAEKVRRDWLPVVRGSEERYPETPLHRQLKEDVGRVGTEAAHALWGTYLYGELGRPPVVGHLDGSETRAGWDAMAAGATDEMRRLVPEGQPFILVDEGTLGLGPSLDGRPCLPFLERDGQYWGAPPDGPTGVRELERMRREGAQFIVFVWSTFWWLDVYPQLHRHLRSGYRCLAESDRVIAFSLKAEAH
jgi:hypothetical protein